MVAITTVKATISQSMRVNRSGAYPASASVPSSAMPPPHRPSRRRRACAVPWRSAPSWSWRSASAIVCASTGGPSERDAVQRFAARLGPPRLGGDAPRGHLRGAGPLPPRRVRRGTTPTRPPRRRSPRCKTGRPRERRRRPLASARRPEDPRVRDDPRQRRPRRRQGRRRVRIAWTPQLVFPGLGAGEQLQRTTQMPDARRPPGPRRHAAGPGPRPQLAAGRHRAGDRRRARPDPRRRARRATRELGYPDGAQVGISGLERAFDERLAGTPGGELRAGVRLLAAARAAQGARRCARRSRPRSRRRRSPRWPGASAASSRCGPRPARSSPPPGSASAACSRRARPSRSSPRPARWRTASPSRATASRSRPRRRSRASSSQNANGESCGGTLVSLLRAVVQLGLRAARRQARRGQARGDRRALRLQRADRDHRRGDRVDPAGRRDRRRPRGRLQRDRPGPRAGHRAADGDRRRDDRPARPPARRHAGPRALDGRADARGDERQGRAHRSRS